MNRMSLPDRLRWAGIILFNRKHTLLIFKCNDYGFHAKLHYFGRARMIAEILNFIHMKATEHSAANDPNVLVANKVMEE